MQFLNNYAILHSRTAYEDFAHPAHKRHLLRLWLTAHNGRDLPPWFLRDGTRSGAGRGGIPPRDHVTR